MDVRIFSTFVLKMAQAKARIGPRLAKLFPFRSTAARPIWKPVSGGSADLIAVLGERAREREGTARENARGRKREREREQQERQRDREQERDITERKTARETERQRATKSGLRREAS